jgi:plastocyanin
MANITTRESGTTGVDGVTRKDAPLSNVEIDNNFIALNTDKLESSSTSVSSVGDKLVMRSSDGQAYASIFNGEFHGPAVLTTVGAGAITAASLSLTDDLALIHGGTGASDGYNARFNLGLTIGGTVSAYNSLLASIAGLSANGVLQKITAPNPTAWGWNVTAADSTNYTFTGSTSGTDISITVVQGDTLEFNVNAPNHPFWIKNTAIVGSANPVIVGVVSNNGATSGTVNWDTAGVPAGTYYYICGSHSAMQGTITVTVPTRVTATNDVQINSLGVGTAAAGTAGEIRATGDIYSAYSDSRLKENVKIIDNALEKILKIDGVTYTANSLAETYGYYNKEQQVGVLAHQVEEVLPEAVKPAPFDMMLYEGTEISKSGHHFKTIQYERLVPLLIEAIKELNNKIEILENK